MLNLFGPDFRSDPYPIYALLRDQAPVYRRVNAGTNSATCFVTRYSDAVHVLRDHDLYVKDIRLTLPTQEQGQLAASPSNIRTLHHHMLNMDGKNHRRLRALVNKAFTARMIEQMQDRFQSIATNLLDDVTHRSHMDLIRDFALPFPIAVIAELLGIPARDRHRLRSWSGLLTSPVPSAARSERRMTRMRGLTDDYVGYMHSLFAQRRADPRADLITSLIRAEEEGDMLSEDELYSMILLLVVVGHETSVNLIGNGLLALFDHSEQMAQLAGQPDLLPAAIEEILRFDCPVERAPMRFATHDHCFQGQQIRRGDSISIVLGSANRDPAQFQSPDRFDMERADNRHIAFGHGIHYCVGAALARLEAHIAIEALLLRFPTLRLAVPRQQLRWGTNPIMRGVRSMPVRWT